MLTYSLQPVRTQLSLHNMLRGLLLWINLNDYCRSLGCFWPEVRGSIPDIPIYTWLKLQTHNEFLEYIRYSFIIREEEAMKGATGRNTNLGEDLDIQSPPGPLLLIIIFFPLSLWHSLYARGSPVYTGSRTGQETPALSSDSSVP